MTTLPAPIGGRPVTPPHLNPTSPRSDVTVRYRPVLDVARGSVAGHQAVAELRLADLFAPIDRWAATMTTIDAALHESAMLPDDRFVSIPLPHDLVGDTEVRARLLAHGDLGAVVLDVTDFTSTTPPQATSALADYRRAGARIAVGGRDDAQPELGGILRLRPSIIRLGAAWTHGIDTHARRRHAIEVTGRLAAQLDAWILADDVTTAGELRELARLGVPLACGPFIGAATADWAEVAAAVDAP